MFISLIWDSGEMCLLFLITGCFCSGFPWSIIRLMMVIFLDNLMAKEKHYQHSLFLNYLDLVTLVNRKMPFLLEIHLKLN